MTGQQTRVNGNSTLEMGNSNQELLSGGKKRKLTAVIIGAIFLLSIGILAFFVLKKSPPQVEPSSLAQNTNEEPVKTIELGQIISGFYEPVRFNGSWISDTEVLYRDSMTRLIIHNFGKNKYDVIYENGAESSFSHELSSDRKYVLAGYSFQKVFRYSFLGYYNIVDVQTRKKQHINDPQGQARQIEHVIWSPVGNALAYVSINDIYYRPSGNHLQEIRITKNGRPQTLSNGVADWVYEEEVFNSNNAMWFSKDGSKLAFATFNDTTTPVMSIPYYGQATSLTYQYTQMVNIRYPKPGRPNPVVTLNVVDLHNVEQLSAAEPHIITLSPPTDLGPEQPILSVVAWADESNLIAIWMNRVQNKSRILLCNTKEGDTCKLVMSVEEPHGWVEMFKPPIFSLDGSRMLMVYSVDQGGDVGKFRHIISIDLIQNKVVPLTHGKYEVTAILQWDHSANEIYFNSNIEGSPSQLVINKIPDTIENAPHDPTCISCIISDKIHDNCLYSGATFSTEASYFAYTCAGPHVPAVKIFNKSLKKYFVWENNEYLKEAVSKISLPTHQDMSVPVGKNTTATVRLHLPPNMHPSQKYPVLVQVYGGPDSNLVEDKFSIDWNTYLTINHNIIVVNIDGRSSGLRGDNLRFASYRKLGSVEVDDVITVTRYLQENLSYIDKNKTAIWGWSYGGYISVKVLANDSRNVFKCGISVAPVTDWLYYDSIYTERYMGLPTLEDNISGYGKASIFRNFDNLSNKEFFLVHGSLDDNVHYQQSMMLAKALEENDILFRQQNYPDEDHSLSKVRPHLYHSLEQFLLKQCYKLV